MALNPFDHRCAGWPFAGGDMAQCVRDHDWAATPLGPVQCWPAALRSTVQAVLAQPIASVVLWGPQLIQVYNDAYRDLMGLKHPAGLGQPTRECWPEVWHINAPTYERVWRGESLSFEDALFPITRSGRLEDAWFTLSYSPVHDATTGAVEGVLVTVFETTRRLQAEQALRESEARQAFLLELSDALRRLSSPQQVLQAAAAMVGRHLGVTQMVYSEADLAQDRVFFHSTYCDGSAAPIAGEFPLSAWGARCVEELAAGRDLVIDDVRSDPRTCEPPILHNYLGVGTLACVAVPLARDGARLSLLGINCGQPRRWTPQEIAMVQATADRTRSAVEQAHAATAVREINQRLEERVAQRTGELEQTHRRLLQANDVSERRRRLYETFLGHSPDLAYVFDLEHRFAYANDVLLRMWGKTWGEAIGKTCLELGYEDWHAAMHDREIEQVKATRQPIKGEVPFNGTFGRRMYEYIFVPVLGPDGTVEAIAGTTRDVTERKKAEEAAEERLHEEQRRNALLARVAQASRLLNTVLSVQAIGERLTREAREIVGAQRAVLSLGFDQGEALAVTVTSLSEAFQHSPGPGEPSMEQDLQAEVRRTNRPVRRALAPSQPPPASQAPGTVPGEPAPPRGWLAVPLVGHGDRNLGVLTLSDRHAGEFTEEDEAIQVQLAAIAATGIENARLYDTLREEDRRKDEFLATLAHELRNPLAPLRNAAHLLATPELRAEQLRWVQRLIERQVGHMARLLDDLLDLARITQGKLTLQPECVSLSSVVDSAVEAARPLIDQKRHTLTVLLDGPDEGRLLLQVDPVRLSQVLSNLLTNAAKYTDAGGHIEFRATRCNDELHMSVRDDGIGLPREARSRIFEMFGQLESAGTRAEGGLGIGLALVRGIVGLHGGRVSADSAGPGQGSCFTVQLPLHAVAVSAPAVAQPDSAHAGLKVLVADDNEDAAQTLEMLLTFAGCQTRRVGSGRAAVEAAMHWHPDVAVLDIGMPDLDGHAVARELRQQPATSAMLLIALTGWGQEEDRRKSTAAGFDHHLTKPVDIDRLLALMALARSA